MTKYSIKENSNHKWEVIELKPHLGSTSRRKPS